MRYCIVQQFLFVDTVPIEKCCYAMLLYYMGLVERKPVFEVSHKARLKLVSSDTETT